MDPLDVELMNAFLREPNPPKVFPRELEGPFEEAVASGLIVTLSGLRRVGKTSLVKKYLYQHREKAFYFSFDDITAPPQKEVDSVVRYALSLGKTLIALDEVQKVQGWEGVVKKYYDSVEGLRFIITGSTSLALSQGVESLAGRRWDLFMYPLTLKEYLTFAPHGPVERYLATGFPELVLKDIPPALYLKALVEKVLQDVVVLKGVKRPHTLRELVELLAERNAKEVDYRGLASYLGVSKDTVKAYILLLSKAFLVEELRPFSPSASASLRKQKKIYFAFPSLAHAFRPQDPGRVVENVVYHHLRQKGKVFFWKHRRWEVDFVFPTPNGPLPIEVKRGNPSRADARPLLAFLERHRQRVGILLSKDVVDEWVMGEKRIKVVPWTAFLLNMEAWIQQVGA